MSRQKMLQSVMLGLLAIFMIGCSRESDSRVQGYVEGKYTYIATSVSGILKQLRVDRGTSVKKGQVLFILEEQPESDLFKAAIEKLRQSIAARDAITANLTYAKLTYERYKILVPKNAIERSRLDNAKSLYEASIAQLNQANANITENRAALAQSKWTKDQKVVIAPVNAIVFDTFYNEGEYTQANQPILSLLSPDNIKVIFYISEAVLGSIHLGEVVSIQCDGCTKSYRGKISFISPAAEYTPPIIYSQETSYKLVYRIEAELNEKDAYRLHPGQPVSVEYNTKSKNRFLSKP